MTTFRSEDLWLVSGLVRRVYGPEERSPAGGDKGDFRAVVITAADYQDAHDMAKDALLWNWSNHPHEVTIEQVRPATLKDVGNFLRGLNRDVCFRVYVTERE